MEYRDGNALAGVFVEAFGVDLTVAVLTCGACGQAGAVAEARVYDRGPGAVMRCSGCEAILIRMARTPTELWLDLRGSASLRIPVETQGSG